jgi:hypothetical protein
MPASIRKCNNSLGFALNQVILYFARFPHNALTDPKRYRDYNARFPSILFTDTDDLRI